MWRVDRVAFFKTESLRIASPDRLSACALLLFLPKKDLYHLQIFLYIFWIDLVVFDEIIYKNSYNFKYYFLHIFSAYI